MYDILRASIKTCPFVCEACNPMLPACQRANDTWLFTDPAARVAYAYAERVHLLKEDIHTNVMHDGQWCAEELAYCEQVQSLLEDKVLAPKGAFGCLSPHPTVYRAVSDGALEVANHRLYIRTGDDVMFMSWLERLRYPGHVGPLRIGRLYCATKMQLCCEHFPAVRRLCQADLAVLRQMLYLDRPS